MPDLLAALTRLHGDLLSAGLLPEEGFSEASMAADVLIDGAGVYLGIEARRPDRQRALMPTLPSRSSNIAAAFLSGKPDYWFGGASARAKNSRAAMRDLHQRVLGGVQNLTAKAILSFLEGPPLLTNAKDLIGFYGIRVDGLAAEDVPEIRSAWSRYYVPSGENPRIQVISGYSLSRLVTGGMPSAESFGQTEPNFSEAVTPKYGPAANWLTSRQTTVRVGNTAIFGWVEGHPLLDPTPHLIRSRWAPEDSLIPDAPTAYPGDVHFVALTLYPPARIACRLYVVVDGDTAANRLRTFRQRLKAAVSGYADWHDQYVYRWQDSVYPSPQQEQVVTGIMQAVLMGHAELPRSVLGEIVRLNRADYKTLGRRIGLLTVALNLDHPGA